MNQIPPMTDPLGKHWNQPDQDSILIDDFHAVMDQRSFDTLSNYSSTIPSGVYDGKMWKCLSAKDGWLLGWYGPGKKENTCSINYRMILVLEGTVKPMHRLTMTDQTVKSVTRFDADELVAYEDDIKHTKKEYTCFGCKDEFNCRSSYDWYNLDGDCLENK